MGLTAQNCVCPEINQLVDFVHGHEGRDDSIGRVARFVQVHGAQHPAAGQVSRWPSVDALRTMIRHHGPTCSQADIDAALAAAQEG